MQGASRLPSTETMWKDIVAKREAMAKRYVDSTRHTIQVDWLPFMDEIAEQVGCKPDLGKFFLISPHLFILFVDFRFYFSTFLSPSQIFVNL